MNKSSKVFAFFLCLVLLITPFMNANANDSWIAVKPIETSKTTDGFKFNFTTDQDVVIFWNDNSASIRKNVDVFIARYNVLVNETFISSKTYRNYLSSDVHWEYCINYGKLKPGKYRFHIFGDNNDGEMVDFIVINNNCKDAKTGYSDLKFISLDKQKEIVIIENTGKQNINLKGYEIRSSRGQQKYIFPNYVLRSGFQVSVARKKGDGDLVWGKGEYVWNDTKTEYAFLSDSKGNLITSIKK